MTVLALLAALSFANDPDVRHVDAGLYAAPATGVAYLTTATEEGWYIEAMDRHGTLLLDKIVVGDGLSEADAVRVARAAQRAEGTELEVELDSGKAKVVVGDKTLSVQK